MQVVYARLKVLQCKCQKESLAEAQKRMQTACCAELHDEALVKDPPAMEDCPICITPPSNYHMYHASITRDYIDLRSSHKRQWKNIIHVASGKTICKGCVQSFCKSGMQLSIYCKSER